MRGGGGDSSELMTSQPSEGEEEEGGREEKGELPLDAASTCGEAKTTSANTTPLFPLLFDASGCSSSTVLWLASGVSASSGVACSRSGECSLLCSRIVDRSGALDSEGGRRMLAIGCSVCWWWLLLLLLALVEPRADWMRASRRFLRLLTQMVLVSRSSESAHSCSTSGGTPISIASSNQFQYPSAKLDVSERYCFHTFLSLSS
mmetsp:Transcript_2586/g.5256  ORF Transcript_2586/g.5256 Transcript_2586/m.5256 type:complete len:204 (-) Transcript_2586:251-862(-)